MKILPIIALALSCLPHLTAQTRAQCLPAPGIQVVQDLFFGGLLVDREGGSIVLTAEGSLLPEGPGVQPGASPAGHEARFRLTGPPKAPFTLHLEPQIPILSGSSGGTARLALLLPSISGMKGYFDAAGTAELRLGGRLDIPAPAQPGYYLATRVMLSLTVQGTQTTTTSANFRISAQMRAPLQLTKCADLDFGSLIPANHISDFQVLPTGGFQSQGPTLVKGSPHPAAFQLQGQTGASYSIGLPQETFLNGPGAPIRLHTFTSDVPVSSTIPPNGLFFHVGGSLQVPPDQRPGAYRGVFFVEVCYP